MAPSSDTAAHAYSAPTPPVEQGEVIAIPHYRWAKGEPGAMRVWIPVIER